MKQNINEKEIMATEHQDQIRACLAKIAKKHAGRLTPEAVIEDAKDPKSPLHTLFEWNVKQAAHRHWIEQARAIIRSVRVDIRTDKVTVTSVAYVRDPDCTGGEQGYVSVESLQTEKQTARLVLISEFRRIASMFTRVNELAVAVGLEHEVEKIHASVIKVQIKLQEQELDT